MAREKGLWSAAFREQDLFDLFSRKVRLSPAQPPPPASAETPFQFSNFVSVTIKPDEDRPFREFLETLSLRFIKEKSVFTEGTDQILSKMASLRKLIGERSQVPEPAPPLLLDDFSVQKAFQGERSLKEFDELLRGVTLQISFALALHSHDFPALLLRLHSFDQQARNVSEHLLYLQQRFSAAKILILNTVAAPQRKLRRRNRLEQVKNQLLMLQRTTEAEKTVQQMMNERNFEAAGDLLLLFEQSLSSLPKKGVFGALAERVKARKEAFASTLRSHALSNLFSYAQCALVGFEALLTNSTPPSFPPSLPPSIFFQIRLFYPHVFLDEFREKIAEIVRKAHSDYVRALPVQPLPALFAAYSRSLNQVFGMHRATMEEMGEGKESALFARMLASQAHRFLKKFIDRFELEGVELDSVGEMGAELRDLARQLGAAPDSALCCLPAHLNRLMLNARQQKLLSGLQRLFEEETWTPAPLLFADEELLQQLFSSSSAALAAQFSVPSLLFFRCFLAFCAHMAELRRVGEFLPEAKTEAELRGVETVELLLERLSFLLVEGYATEYKRLLKINTRVLALAALQLHLLAHSLPLAQSRGELQDKIKRATHLFIDKIVSVMQSVLERSAGLLSLPDSDTPTLAARQVAGSLHQLMLSVPQLLPPCLLDRTLREVSALVEGLVLSPMRSAAHRDLPFLLESLAVLGGFNVSPAEA